MPERQNLPERVKALIAEQELSSERLIGGVQLGLAAMMGMLFFFSPRPADAPMTIEPVPLAIGAYILFTLVRLLVSYRVRVPGWLVVLSILIDMTLLIGLIWTFHIQYAQPASFSLQVPTFIFIFVFIALRALRFDHRYVLCAGLSAAIGWVALIIYAELDSKSRITRSFIEYVNGNAILRGAEVEKIVIILLITGILSLAIWRARTTLFTAVRESTTSQEMSRFLTPGIARRIATSETTLQAGEAAERDAAIMMIDIRGFTTFSTKHPPADVVHMLTGYHSRVLPIIERHNGVVDKFMGDGVMVTFGAIEPSETAAADALRALEDVIGATAAWQSEIVTDDKLNNAARALDVNAAVASGRVVLATLGDADRLEYTVIGPAVNLAAKLEKHNKEVATRALTTKETYQVAREQGFEARLKVRNLRRIRVAGTRTATDLVAFEPPAGNS